MAIFGSAEKDFSVVFTIDLRVESSAAASLNLKPRTNSTGGKQLRKGDIARDTSYTGHALAAGGSGQVVLHNYEIYL